MPGSSPRQGQSAFPAQIPALRLHLTDEEWGMIVKALSAYRHNAIYRELYDKLVLRKPQA